MNNQNYLLAKPYVNHVSVNELEDRHSMIPTTHKMEHDFGIPSFTSDPTLDKMKENLAYGVLNQYEKAKLADRIEKLKNRLERTLPENQKEDKSFSENEQKKLEVTNNGDHNGGDENHGKDENNDQVNTNRKIQELSDNTKHDSKDKKDDDKTDAKDNGDNNDYNYNNDQVNTNRKIQELSDNTKHDSKDKEDHKKDTKDEINAFKIIQKRLSDNSKHDGNDIKDDDKKDAKDNGDNNDNNNNNDEITYDHHNYKFAGEGDKSGKNFNFAAVGDFGCSKNSKNTVNNMEGRKPELVLPLGDLSYIKSANCWFDTISPLKDKLKVTLGFHDVNDGESKLNQYKESFGLDKLYYSFDYRHVHFITMDSESQFDKSSEQYNFVKQELEKASKDKDCNWIIVTSYGPFYTSPTTHKAEKSLRDLYHPLFEKYGVDLVLQAHNHNYQRTYPITYNPDESSKPIIANDLTTGYTSQKGGTIFAIVGTGGESFYALNGQDPSVAKQFGGKFGFLNIDISNGNPHTKLTGTFYDNKGGDIKDNFTIEKEIKSNTS